MRMSMYPKIKAEVSNEEGIVSVYGVSKIQAAPIIAEKHKHAYLVAGVHEKKKINNKT